MIQWIERLPDSMTGVLAAAILWFGFNYVVLAERAMEKDGKADVVPRCVERLGQLRGGPASPSGIGALLGIPDLDRIEALVIARTAPRILSIRERIDQCACGARRAARRIRFDYAVHTSTFRIVAPQSVATFGDATVDVLAQGMCGAIPSRRGD